MTEQSAGPGADLPVVLELDREECLRLLATAAVGRVVYTTAALPAVHPVAFRLRGRDILFRTDRGAVLAGVPGAVVGFQADDVDPTSWTGWSVVAVGEARWVAAHEQAASVFPSAGAEVGEQALCIRAQRLTGWARRL
jgi:nitroimidazol reductase NimA-like FMN-containing flavoprotein (pyridoxamine 5'-phosphate oxidase superfamily)